MTTQDEPRAEEASTDEPSRAARTPAEQARRRRWLKLGLFVGSLAFMGLFVLPRVPRSQHVRVHLGPGSSRVVQLTARVSRGGALDRESSFRFARGAPPSLAWDFELPNGEAELEIELASSTGISERKVWLDLRGEEANVEVGEALRALP